MDGNHEREKNRNARISFSRRLADWRYTLNLSRKEFAAAIGVGYSTFCHWLTARRSPNFDNLQNAADAVSVPPSCMLCNRDDTRCKSCKAPKPLRCPDGHPDCPRTKT